MPESELRREIEHLRRANDELSFLNDLSQSIGLSFDSEEVMRTIIKKSIRTVGADQGTVVLVDEEGGSDPDTLVRSVVTLRGKTTYSLDQMLIGWMVINRTVLNLTDPRSDSRFLGVDWDESIRSVVCVPLLLKSSLIGILSVFNKRGAPSFTQDDLRLLTIIAGQSAQVIENARLYGVEELHEQLKSAQTELVQSKKMAALGALVAGLVHEMNTPLGAMNSAKDLSVRCLDKIAGIIESGDVGDEIRGQIQPYLSTLEKDYMVIEEAAERIGRIVNSLKSFARLDEAQIQKVDLHEGLESALTLIEPVLSERIHIEKEYGDIPRVSCHAAEINQVFMHLLTNAAQAIGAGGTITIRTRAVDDNVRVEIADTGPGISESQMRRLFDPTFSKKGTRVKAGLGLFTCSNIVGKHSGEIAVHSEMGQGSTFAVVLPTRSASTRRGG
jgi:signal transduction histidine kinase